eukprot:2965143-Prymnesium_polylepis.1
MEQNVTSGRYAIRLHRLLDLEAAANGCVSAAADSAAAVSAAAASAGAPVQPGALCAEDRS